MESSRCLITFPDIYVLCDVVHFMLLVLVPVFSQTSNDADIRLVEYNLVDFQNGFCGDLINKKQESSPS